MKTISIVTPCYNSGKYLAETIESVLNQTAVQSGRVALEYFIQDGASTDETIKIVESFASPSIRLTSERDRGMYDALAKGLRQATGDITAYINAGDYYHKCAFDVVLEMFEKPGTSWLTGFNVLYNERSQVIGVMLPYKFRPNFFACGLYDGRLPMLQQESTFWATALHETLDFDRLSSFKYAGDFYLWRQFATASDLKIVQSCLGGFKFHRGQISEDKSAYVQEMHTMTRTARPHERLLALCDKVLWHTPSTVKKKFHPNGIYRFDHASQDWV